MWRDWKFFLLLDNAHPHTASIVQPSLTKKGVAQLGHPPYSPDLSPLPPLFRFPKIKIGAERRPLCFDRRYSEICNHEIKSVPNSWLRRSYEMARRSRKWVYSSIRRLFRINITYLNFCIFFHRFCSVVAKLTGHTLYMGFYLTYCIYRRFLQLIRIILKYLSIWFLQTATGILQLILKFCNPA